MGPGMGMEGMGMEMVIERMGIKMGMRQRMGMRMGMGGMGMEGMKTCRISAEYERND